MKKSFDVLIIGGGASGLICAVSAKKKNPHISVAIIEKNDRVGKKLLATGNGRCNLTNKIISSDRYVGSFKTHTDRIFSKYSSDYLIEYFKNLGLLSFADSEGRYYPISRQASSVLDTLRFACDRLGVEICCGENIRTVRKIGGRFIVKTAEKEFIGNKLVIACGSKASPKLGGSASGADYLKNFGHRFVPFSPALCPIKVNSDILKSLKGLRALGDVRLYNGDKLIKLEHGEIQFAENSLSGICIFNLSLYAKKEFIISIDLLNNISGQELYLILNKNKELFSELTVDNLMTGIFHKRLGQAILKMSGIRGFSRLCKQLSDEEIKKIIETTKSMNFEVLENAGFEQAQCSIGGVHADELDEKTFMSKRVENLYICGEAVDLCGECGGFNLHFAFVSGIIVGENL